MKKITKVTQLISAIVLAGFASMSFSADDDSSKNKRNGDRSNGVRLERMTESLDLTTDQVVQLEELQASIKAQREVNQEERSQTRTDLNEALMGILSTEQWTAYQESQENRSSRKNRGENRDSDSDLDV